MLEDIVDKMIDPKYPSKLLIALISGEGKIVKRIILKGVKFKSGPIIPLDLDYTKTEVLTHTVKLTYKNIKWK